MANVLYAWEYGEAAGHVGAFRPIGEKLLGVGHRLFLSLKDLSLARQMFPQPEVLVTQAPSRNARSNHRLVRPDTFGQILHNTGFYSADQIATLIEAWIPIIDGINPQLVIADFAPVATILADSLSIPFMLFGTGYVIPPSTTPLMQMKQSSGNTQDSRSDEERLTEVINAALRRHGLREICSIGSVMERAKRRLLMTFPELDHYAMAPRDEYYGVWCAGGGARPEFPKRGKVKAFAYLKPFQHIEELFRLLELFGISTIVSSDGIPSGIVDKFKGRGIYFTSEKIDIDYAASNADFAITNGNHGTTAQMLFRGLPVLACPLHQEQQITAHNLASHGIGVWLNPNEQQKFAEKIAQIALDQDLRNASKAFQLRYGKYDDFSRIEKCFNDVCDWLQLQGNVGLAPESTNLEEDCQKHGEPS